MSRGRASTAVPSAGRPRGAGGCPCPARAVNLGPILLCRSKYLIYRVYSPKVALQPRGCRRCDFIETESSYTIESTVAVPREGECAGEYETHV